MTALPQRQELVADIEQACKNGVPLGSACAELGLSARTVARWRRTGEVRADARPTAPRPAPAHKLSEQERQRVLDVCHEPRFADLPPAQIVPRLADEGTYLASESSFYRILRAAQEPPSVKIVVASSNWSSNLPWGDGFDDDKIHQREEGARAQSNERTA